MSSLSSFAQLRLLLTGTSQGRPRPARRQLRLHLPHRGRRRRTIREGAAGARRQARHDRPLPRNRTRRCGLAHTADASHGRRHECITRRAWFLAGSRSAEVSSVGAGRRAATPRGGESAASFRPATHATHRRGGFFGLPANMKAALRSQLEHEDWRTTAKLGWDVAHVETTRVSIAEAKAGKR
jgi:hypothetical protein